MIDTNVVSEARKGAKADPGVREFFARVAATGETLYLSVVSLGELRRGVDMVRHRGDRDQAMRLEAWLTLIVDEYGGRILNFEREAAQVWGRLRVPGPAHAIDKQIAAIALVHDLTVVTRNMADFGGTGVRVMNPFRALPAGVPGEQASGSQ